jgi:hypothetical protein
MLGLVQMTTPTVQLSHLLRSVGLRELLGKPESHSSMYLEPQFRHWLSGDRMATCHSFKPRHCRAPFALWPGYSPIIAAMLGAGVFAQSFELGFESYGTPFRGGGHGAFRALSEFGSNQRRQFETK